MDQQTIGKLASIRGKACKCGEESARQVARERDPSELRIFAEIVGAKSI